MAAGDGQFRDGGFEIEAARACGAGVDNEAMAVAFDEWLVGVAVDKYVRRVAREKFGRSWTAQFMTVADMDRQTAHLERDVLGECAVQRIDVAVHCLDRRNCAEPVEDFTPADISRMQDPPDAGQGVEQAVTQQAVRV